MKLTLITLLAVCGLVMAAPAEIRQVDDFNKPGLDTFQPNGESRVPDNDEVEAGCFGAVLTPDCPPLSGHQCCLLKKLRRSVGPMKSIEVIDTPWMEDGKDQRVEVQQ